MTWIIKTIKENWLFCFTLLVAGVFYYTISISKHINFDSYSYDLGIYAQSSWLISHLKTPFSTIRGINQFGDHFSPVYVFVSMGYSVFNSPIYLLAVQIISVLAGGAAVYLMAKNVLKSKVLGCLIFSNFITQVGLVSALRFDFHLATLSVGFVSWCLYFWYKRKFGLYLVFLILSIMTKEDIPVLFIVFSAYLLYKRMHRWALTTLVCSIFWFALTTKLIIPFFQNSTYGYAVLGDFFSGWEIKSKTLYQTLGQNLGIALLSGLSWPFLIANLLTRFGSETQSRWEMWHYGANLAPALGIGMILGLKRIRKFLNQKSVELSKATIYTLSILALLSSIHFVQQYIRKTTQVNSKAIENLLRQIPPDASVSAQNSLSPHLGNREKIYLFPRASASDYIVLSPKLDSYPLEPKRIEELTETLLRNKNYSSSEAGGVFVFKKIS